MKTGLALSGGGALGAYEAGALLALSELGTNVDSIAGTSIGALNGAVLTSATTLASGSDKLVELWRNLAEKDIFKANYYGLFTLLMSMGAPLSSFSASLAEYVPSPGLCSSEPVRELLEQTISPEKFDYGPPFYVGVDRVTRFAGLKFFAALAGFGNTDSPCWFHIQKFPVQERLKPVIASAAIPIIFSSQPIGGNLYMDGGMADWLGETGNTPVEPLVNSGCRIIIAVLLKRSSPFNRLRYSDATIIEIRPQKDIYCNPSIGRIINFNRSQILQAIEDGFEDCMKKMREIKAVLNMEIDNQKDFAQLEQSVQRLNDSRERMQAILRKIKGRD